MICKKKMQKTPKKSEIKKDELKIQNQKFKKIWT